jgi:hypothetical protein
VIHFTLPRDPQQKMISPKYSEKNKIPEFSVVYQAKVPAILFSTKMCMREKISYVIEFK